MKNYDSQEMKRPPRRRKESDSKLDTFDAYVKLKKVLEGGGLPAGGEYGVILDDIDLGVIGSKHPERMVTDNVRRLIAAYNLVGHTVTKYRTMAGGWLVFVANKPRSKRKVKTQEGQTSESSAARAKGVA